MKRKSRQLEDPPDLCKRGENHADALCMEENATHRSSEGTSSVPILEPRHKIFLSHSGFQKEFVDHLCEALERRSHNPFYDRRCTSLPKGERFPPLILKAAEECEMAVVVVSEEYFMSKWPMIELNAFVQAIRQKSNLKLKILPLFYGLSVGEFCEERRRVRWYDQWEIFAKEDAQGRIKVDEWKDALDMLGSFNGLSYDRESKEIVAYEDAIVSSISQSIQPDIKWDDSHVQGKWSICEVVRKKIDEIGPSHMFNVKVVGIYGLGGIGKTTMCKTLCNELSNAYEGRVCHVEFESKSRSLKGLLDEVLVRLTNTSLEVLQQVNESQCMDIFRRTVQRQRTFLAVDNVWDDYESMKQAKMFLKGPFHEGSVVVVTSRSLRTLELLGIDGDASLEMPDLGLEDAIKLFVYHAGGGKMFAKEEQRDILECIARCHFRKGDGQGWHYHPLALEALGLQLSCFGQEPSEWVKNLFRVKNFSYLSGKNPVFGILRSSFDVLSPSEQSLFMDVVNCYRNADIWRDDWKEWLCLVYKQDEAEIKRQLDCLRRRGLLQDVDLESGKFRVHDLYREFAELEVRGKLDESRDLEKRMWAYVENGDLSELEGTPGNGSGHKLIRLHIGFGGWEKRIERLEGINWQYCRNVVVLILDGDIWFAGGALSLEPLKCLRSFESYNVLGLDRVEGMEGLKYLTYFRWVHVGYVGGYRGKTHMGQFPASLVILIITVQMLFEPGVLAQCTKLSRLELVGVEAGNLDLSNCSSLQRVSLTSSEDLVYNEPRLTPRWACGIKSLTVSVWNLVDIPESKQLANLERLELNRCESMVQLDLQWLTKLQVLVMDGGEYSSLCLPPQLRELRLQEFNDSRLCEGLNVVEVMKASGLKQLQVLDLSHNRFSTGLENLGGWPALRCLDLSWGGKILGLPDLSQSTNLEELHLVDSEVELHDKDIRMLARLPLLQPVRIGIGNNRLDCIRGKLLRWVGLSYFAPDSWEAWKEHEWEEQDLGVPPYVITRSFVFVHRRF